MLEWLCAEEHLDMILGDLEELYQLRLEQKGRVRARLHFIIDAFDMLRPFALKRPKGKHKLKSTIMFRNYFKISFRNMLRHKVYALINLVGLSIGITCFMLIFLYIQDELSYDKYHADADDIYRVVIPTYNSDGELGEVFGNASFRTAELLRGNFPQIESVVRFNPYNFPVIEYEDKRFEEGFFNLVEPSIFDIFSFEWIEGQASGALDEPFSVVITQSTAEKYFGTERALGKTLKIIDGGDFLFKVTGVVKDFPEQSHMNYNFLGSWATVAAWEDVSGRTYYFGNYNYPTYIKLADDAKIENVESQIPALIDQYVAEFQGIKASKRYGMIFQPLTEIRLKGTPLTDGAKRIFYVNLFFAIGLMVLLIACINYMNLATAKYANRLKEIGVRKVMGAGSGGIAQQFLVESLVYTLISLCLSVVFAVLSLPYLNSFADKSLKMDFFSNVSLYVFLLAMAVFVGLMAGSYPAFFMSRFKTINALRNGKLNIGKRSLFRTSMVVFQFILTTCLIVGVIVVDKQLNFIRDKDPGFDKEMVVTFSANSNMNEQREIVKNKLLSNPKVLKASFSTRVPTGRLADSQDAAFLDPDGVKDITFRLPYIRIDDDFLDLYGIELLTGKEFQTTIPADSNQSFLINETAVKKLGFSSPEEALDRRLQYGSMRGFITGVVKDFHFESFHSPIEPMIFYNSPEMQWTVSVKIAKENTSGTLSFLEDSYKVYNPDRSFDSSFLIDSFDRQYEPENQMSRVSKVFSTLAIFIACIGLMGLVSYTLELRAKEISVRKVLGATILSILLMINKSYSKTILIAFFAALPLSVYALQNWLDSFAYHIDIGAGIITLAGLVTFAIAVITICSQAMRFAKSNPVKWLRSE